MAKKPIRPSRLGGKSIAFTGTLRHSSREQAVDRVRAEGGTVVEAVTATLDYLVIGHTRSGTSAQEKKALALNQKGAHITLLDEGGFRDLFRPAPDELLEALQGGARGLARLKEMAGFWCTVHHASALGSPVDLRDADLRRARLDDADLTGIRFLGVDFRGAHLARVRIQAAEDCNFDGATLHGASFLWCKRCTFRKANFDRGAIAMIEDCTLDGMRLRHGYFSDTIAGCSVRNADLSDTRLNPADLSGSDFTGTRIPRSLASYTQGVGSVFVRADLSEGSFDESTFTGADFTAAELWQMQLHKSDFTDAKLIRAKLMRSDLRQARLVRTDLSGADLTDANLSDADLTNATLTGANLQGTILIGANLTGVDLSKAKNLDQAALSAGGAVGPNLRELAGVATAAHKLESTADLDVAGERVTVAIHLSHHGGRAYASAGYTHYQPNLTSCSSVDAPTFDQGMLNLAKRWAQGKLHLDRITAKASKCSRKPGELRDLAIAAWCEAFGLTPPSADELAEQKQRLKEDQQQVRATMLDELHGGPARVKRWNARSHEERCAAGPFRKLDLSGRKLARIRLASLDLQGCCFDGADLTQANLDNCDLRSATFRNARLDGAWMPAARLAGAVFTGASLVGANVRAIRNWRGADFHQADLSKADLSFSDLRGVDLSGATLKGIQLQQTPFDEATRFPPGFRLPKEGLVWRGTGPDPRLAPPEPAAPVGSVSLEQFMDSLRKLVDSARLGKALAMLKAERFQLFAQADAEAVIGVVKSQSSKDLVYSCRLTASGSYACCTQNLHPCGGLRGALCKHLLVLIVGLTRAGTLDPATVEGWVKASRTQNPRLDADGMSATFLRYKGAEAGEVDWRPTETVPEDYYTL